MFELAIKYNVYYIDNDLFRELTRSIDSLEKLPKKEDLYKKYNL